MSLENGTSSTIIKDSPEYRFTWASPSISPNNNYIIASVLKNTDRTKANLMLIDVDKGKGNIITDTKKGRFFPDILSTWIDNGSKVLYTSDEDGYKNVYSYDIYKGKTMQVTKFTEDVANAEIATIEGKEVPRRLWGDAAHTSGCASPAPQRSKYRRRAAFDACCVRGNTSADRAARHRA